MQIEMTETEFDRVLAALTACMRSGGGSATWTLIRKLSSQCDRDLNYALVKELSSVCIREAFEYIEQTPSPELAELLD